MYINIFINNKRLFFKNLIIHIILSLNIIFLFFNNKYKQYFLLYFILYF